MDRQNKNIPWSHLQNSGGVRNFAPEGGQARHAASEFWQGVSVTNHLHRIGRTCLCENY